MLYRNYCQIKTSSMLFTEEKYKPIENYLRSNWMARQYGGKIPSLVKQMCHLIVD